MDRDNRSNMTEIEIIGDMVSIWLVQDKVFG